MASQKEIDSKYVESKLMKLVERLQTQLKISEMEAKDALCHALGNFDAAMRYAIHYHQKLIHPPLSFKNNQLSWQALLDYSSTA
jgi:hypothetical protein